MGSKIPIRLTWENIRKAVIYKYLKQKDVFDANIVDVNDERLEYLLNKMWSNKGKKIPKGDFSEISEYLIDSSVLDKDKVLFNYDERNAKTNIYTMPELMQILGEFNDSISVNSQLSKFAEQWMGLRPDSAERETDLRIYSALRFFCAKEMLNNKRVRTEKNVYKLFTKEFSNYLKLNEPVKCVLDALVKGSPLITPAQTIPSGLPQSAPPSTSNIPSGLPSAPPSGLPGALNVSSSPPPTVPLPPDPVISGTPPPGTTPSSTAARVACSASSTRAFFSFISTSVAAPTLMTATPPASLASRSCSFSRS